MAPALWFALLVALLLASASVPFVSVRLPVPATMKIQVKLLVEVVGVLLPCSVLPLRSMVVLPLMVRWLSTVMSAVSLMFAPSVWTAVFSASLSPTSVQVGSCAKAPCATAHKKARINKNLILCIMLII